MGPVVCNALYSLPQTPSVSAVTEAMSYPPGILHLSLSDAMGQVGSSCSLTQSWVCMVKMSSQDEKCIWVGCLLLTDVVPWWWSVVVGCGPVCCP